MENLGKWLAQARQAQGITLEEVEEITRIRSRYLEALEIGDYDALPGGEAQVRGFLRRYSVFLNLAPDEAIARYELEVHGERRKKTAVVSPPAPATSLPLMEIVPSRRRWLWIPALVGAVALLGLGTWWLMGRAGQAESPPPELSPSLTPTPSRIPSQPVENTPSPEISPTFPVVATGGVTLTLHPLEHVWVRVTADDLIVFEGMLDPESPQTWGAQEMVIVETGNGAGVVAEVNGQSQGPIGSRGEASARGWAPDGELEVPPPSVLPSELEEGVP